MKTQSKTVFMKYILIFFLIFIMFSSSSPTIPQHIVDIDEITQSPNQFEPAMIGTLTLEVDGDGLAFDWSDFPTAGEDWDKIDDPVDTPDDDTTYIYTPSTLLEYSTLENPIAYYDIQEITKVVVHSRIRVDNTGSQEKIGLRIASTNEYSTDLLATSVWVDYSYEATTQPDSNPWTWDAIDNLEAVNFHAVITGTMYVTQTYVVVHFVEIPAEDKVRISVWDVDEIETVWEPYDAGSIWFTMFSNWGNATWTIWSTNVNGETDLIAYLEDEGMYYYNKDYWIGNDGIGWTNITILVNATDSGGNQAQQVRDFSLNHKWLWINYRYPPTFGYTLSIDTDTRIILMDNLFKVIDFYTFEVYVNNSRIYSDIYVSNSDFVYNVTVKNRFGDAVNSTIFNSVYEWLIFIDVHSFKFMNWYNGFLRVNVTRAGVTYSEIIMPIEIIEFVLFEATYLFTVDFLNGTTKYSQEITVTNSTGYIITGDTIADVYSLVDNTYNMVNQVNITVTTIEDNTLTIQLMFDWSNTTLYNQSITIIAAFDWTNTTLYNQTVSISAAFNSTNTVLYDQIILIQNMFDWGNTTIFNQTISILNAFNATNSVLYTQTISILANISNTNTTIYSQTVSILSDIANTNSTIYSQTLTILSDISNTNITLYSQTVSILSDISNTNSTLYSQTITILSDITNVNSTIFFQTVDILNYVWNNATSIYNQTITILSDIQNSNSTIYSQTVTILSQITNMNSTIYTQTVDILNYVWNNATSIYNQTISILSDIANTNSTIYSQTVTLLADISNTNSTLYAQTITLIADISNTNSTLYAQTLTILTNIENVNSTLYTQTLTILTDVANVNSTLYTQTLTILTDIQNSNSTLYAQTITILSQITNVNSTIYAQTITILSNLAELNATIFLVDDPTNLNPLILGYSLSDDYADFTIVTNWHNSSISIYDNDEIRSGPTSELLSPIRYPLMSTSGTHNLSVLIDAGADSFWYNISYTVVVVISFEIEEYNYYLADGFVNFYIRTTWGNSTIYAYDNGSLVGTFSGEGAFYWWKDTDAGIHNLEINVTSGSSVITLNPVYYVPIWSDTRLAVVTFSLVNMQDNYTLFTITTNWQNATVDIYFNGSLVVSGAIEGMINITRPSNVGLFNVTVVVDGGTDSKTLQAWIRTTEEGTTTYDTTNNASNYEDNRVMITEEIDEKIVVEGDLYQGDDPETAQYETMGMITYAIAVPAIGAIFYFLGVGRQKRKRVQPDVSRGTDAARELAGRRSGR